MKKLLAIIMAAGIIFTGCAQTPAPKTEDSTIIDTVQPEQYVFTDALDREVTVQNPQKVAVAMGSFADVWQLAGGELHAVTEDAFSEKNLILPENVVDFGSTKAPNVEVLVQEGIDFLILSSKTKEHVELQSTLDQMKINYAYFEVDYFEDYLKMLDICTNITGKKDMYEKNGLSIQAQIDAAIANSPAKETAPKVLFIRAFSTGANAQSSKHTTGKTLKDLGCVNIADSEGGVLENLSIENIIKEDPEYIFVITMGASKEKALDALKESLTSNPAWQTLSAVKNDKYIILDKELFHLKPNERWGESYETLAKLLEKSE